MFKKVVVIALFMVGGFAFAQDGVHWAKDFQSGIEQATKEHKPVLFIISRDTCKYCVMLDNTTLQDPTVVQKLNTDFVAIRSWTNEGDYIPMLLRQNTPGLPGIWFLKENGEPMYAPLLGYVKKDAFSEALDIVQKEYEKQKKEKK